MFSLLEKVITNAGTFKTLIISYVIVYILKNIDITTFINSIVNLEFGNFKISKEKALEEQKKEEQNIHSLEQSNTIEKDKLESAMIRKQIIQIIVDNDKITYLIERCLVTSKSISIPLNLIPKIYKLDEIDKIFEYKLQANSIKILSIKKELQPTLIDVYNELKLKGIIYSTG